MPRIRIKICGVTRVDDALAACEYGADAIGMVRHTRSPRCVPDAVVCEIIDALPAMVTSVLLFVNEVSYVVAEAARGLGAGCVQFSGDEQAADVADVTPLRVIKAMRVEAESIRLQLTQWQRLRPANLCGIVLETAGQIGGSGVPNDFDLLRRLRDEHYLDPLKSPPLIFAGGLTPENVGDIVREFQPYAVDVSSGVEDGVKGVKSREKMAEFIAAVHEASVQR